VEAVNLIGLIKERARNYRCVSCSQTLGDCEVQLLSQKDAHCTVEVTCGRCGFTFIAVLLLKRKTHPDGLPKNVDDPISSDDLLDVHEQLKGFDGSFTQLLQPQSRRN
jgi:hypothetical protein